MVCLNNAEEPSSQPDRQAGKIPREPSIALTKGARYGNVGLALIICISLFYFLSAMQWGVVEFMRAAAGIVALWLPLGSLCYVLLREEAPDRAVRFTLSAVAAYCLTTLAYFLFRQ